MIFQRLMNKEKTTKQELEKRQEENEEQWFQMELK